MGSTHTHTHTHTHTRHSHTNTTQQLAVSSCISPLFDVITSLKTTPLTFCRRIKIYFNLSNWRINGLKMGQRTARNRAYRIIHNRWHPYNSWYTDTHTHTRTWSPHTHTLSCPVYSCLYTVGHYDMQ